VVPPAHVLNKAKQFAEQVILTVDYRDSYQFNPDKIIDDHWISKIGEEAVYSVFSAYTTTVSEPDYQIYVGKQKGWGVDLTVNQIGLAVKTQKQTTAQRYGLSWTFQCDPQGRSDPVLTLPEAWVCFVSCDDTTPSLSCTVFPPLQMKEIIFGQPKLPKLRGKKLVVYAADNGLLPPDDSPPATGFATGRLS
jgi:hypothetical protein